MFNILALLLLALMTQACSLAPFSASTSGRSYGAGKMQSEFGNANGNYFIKVGGGLSQNLDVGYLMEFGAMSTSGIFTKYSFLNNAQGPSLAMELAYGGTDTTTYYYGGVVASLAFNKNLEIFINPRINYVETDATDIDLGKEYGNLVLNEFKVTYLQVSYGLNLWFTGNVGLSLYGIWFKGQEIQTVSEQSYGATMLFNF
jgi:hypothetical protein